MCLLAVSRDTSCKHLKTFLFAGYWYIQRVRGFTTMSSINLSFTYLLYFSEFRWTYHSSQIFRRCVACGETELCAESWQCEVRRWRWSKAGTCSADTDGLNNVRQIHWIRPIEDCVHDAAQFELDAHWCYFVTTVLFWWDHLQFLGSRIPKISHRTLK